MNFQSKDDLPDAFFPFCCPTARMGTWGASRVGTGVLGFCVCVHLPPAVPALGLALLPREQIVGCTQCSWPSPDVNPRVLAIDGWSKNSPCFPVYALGLPLRSSWIKTAGLDKIAFLFIALGASIVMVERGWVDLNRLLGGCGWCDTDWLCQRGLLGAWLVCQALGPGAARAYHTPPHLQSLLWATRKEKMFISVALWRPRLLCSTLMNSFFQSFPVRLLKLDFGCFQRGVEEMYFQIWLEKHFYR